MKGTVFKLWSLIRTLLLTLQDLCGRQVVLGGSGGSRITSGVIQGIQYSMQ